MKHRIIPFLALALLYVTATAQGEWKWAHYWTGGDGLSYGNFYNKITNTAFDEEGNIYVYGTMGGSAVFDGTSLQFTTNAEVLYRNDCAILLAKFDTLGNMLWYKVVKNSGSCSVARWMEIRDNVCFISGDTELEYCDAPSLMYDVWLYYLDTLIQGWQVHDIPVEERKPPFQTGRWSFFTTLDLDGNVLDNHFVKTLSREQVGSARIEGTLCENAGTIPNPVHIDRQGGVYVYTPIQYKGLENDPFTIIVDSDTGKTYNLYLPGNTDCTNPNAFINNAMLYKFSSEGELLFAKTIVESTDGIFSTGDSINRQFYTYFKGLSFDENDNMYVTGYVRLGQYLNGQGGELHNYPVHIWWDSTHCLTINDISSARYGNFIIKYDTSGNIVWCNQVFTEGTQVTDGFAEAEWFNNIVYGGNVYVVGSAGYDRNNGAAVYFDNVDNPLNCFLEEPTNISFFVKFDAMTGQYLNQGVVPAANAFPGNTPAVLNNRVFTISRCNSNTEYWLVMWSDDGIFIKADTINSSNSVQINKSYGLCINEDGYILASLLSTSPVTFDNNISVNCSTEHSNAVFALYHDPRFAEPFVPDDTVDIAEYQHNRESDIYLYPNPTHGTTTVCGYMYGYQNIELYDLQGRKLGNLVENGSQIPTLDLSPYPAGTYLVKINFARGVSVTRKVVKME